MDAVGYVCPNNAKIIISTPKDDIEMKVNEISTAAIAPAKSGPMANPIPYAVS